MLVKGWAHICFLPPFDEHDNYESFQGHFIDGETKKIYGLRGQLMDYDDPEQNDCMDPLAFYRLVISDYSDNDHSIRSLVIRREMHNDFAALASLPSDNTHFDQADLSFYYEPTAIRTNNEAYQHCEKYLPKLIRDYNNQQQEDQADNNVADWLVTLGSVTFEDFSL